MFPICSVAAVSCCGNKYWIMQFSHNSSRNGSLVFFAQTLPTDKIPTWLALPSLHDTSWNHSHRAGTFESFQRLGAFFFSFFLFFHKTKITFFAIFVASGWLVLHFLFCLSTRATCALWCVCCVHFLAEFSLQHKTPGSVIISQTCCQGHVIK